MNKANAKFVNAMTIASTKSEIVVVMVKACKIIPFS
jgi:hypothetical protein